MQTFRVKTPEGVWLSLVRNSDPALAFKGHLCCVRKFSGTIINNHRIKPVFSASGLVIGNPTRFSLAFAGSFSSHE